MRNENEDYIVEQDGRMVLYRRHMVYDDERKCWTAKTELVGEADTISRELNEIKERSRGSMRFSTSLAKKLGSSYVLLSVAESEGLRDDLFDSFGRYGDWMLAMAVSMIRAPIDSTSAPDLESNMSRELLGIIDGMDQSLIGEFFRKVGSMDYSMEELFRRRVSRSGKVLVADTPYIGEFGDVEAIDNEPGYWVSCDEKGIPVHYLSGTMRDLREYGFDRYQNDIRMLGAKQRTFILEKRTGNADLYDRLIERDSRFVSVSKSRTPCTLNAADRLRTMGAIHRRAGVSYSVYSTAVAIVAKRIRKPPAEPDEDDCTDTMDIVTDGDPRFRESPPKLRFRMWAFNEMRESAIDRDRMERKISVIERRLRTLPPQDAMDQFQETAGSLSRFFNISVKDGTLDLEVRRRELDMYLDQTPLVYFSHGFETWEEMMDAFEQRKAFDTAMSALQGQLRVKIAVADPDFDRGRTYVRFVALVTWCLLARRLEEAGIDEDVGTVLDWLDSVRAVGDGITWRTVGLTPRNRSTMVRIGVKPPTNSITTLPYDYKPEK